MSVFQVVARLGEKVQLAAGLDEEGKLNEAAIRERALKYLATSLPFLSDIESANLRIVGTNALRDAHDRQAFIERAETQLLVTPSKLLRAAKRPGLSISGAAHAFTEERAPLDCRYWWRLNPISQLVKSLNPRRWKACAWAV